MFSELKNVLSVLVIAGSAVGTQAALTTPDIGTLSTGGSLGWTRGDANSTYQHWDVFTTPVGAPGNSPDVANSNPNGTANLQQSDPTAFVTSGGNIYSFAAATAFEVTVPEFGNAGNFTRVMVQWTTQGNELDYASLLLDGAVPVYSEEIGRMDLGGMGGALVDYLAVWDLSDNPTSFELTFHAAGSSMSLDQFVVDTHNRSTPFPSLAGAPSVPEPTTLAMVGIAASFFAVTRRRAKQ